MTESTAVIIPVHNGERRIGAQLAALARQRCDVPFQVIVVLDQCVDDTENVVRSFADRLDLRCIASSGSGSAAAARNSGARATDAPALLFCDDDDVVDDDWVEAMTAALVDADIAGATIRVDRSAISDRVYQLLYAQVDGKAVHADGFGGRYVLSASLAVRRSTFELLGGFAEFFPNAGGEEVDLCRRALRSGARLTAARTTVTYTPRSTLRALIRQRRAYASGVAINRHLNGQTVESARPVRAAGLGIRRSFAALVRERPASVSGAVAAGFLRFVALRGAHDALEVTRQLTASSTTPAVHFLERTVDHPGVPILDNRLFDCPDDGAGYLVDQGIEAITLSILTDLLRPGDTFVDGGANIGLFSVAAGLVVGPSGQVMAFEPQPAVATALGVNMGRHCPSVPFTSRRAAVGSDAGVRRLFGTGNSPISTLHPAPDGTVQGAPSWALEVDAVKLDDEVVGIPDVIKLDIEGSEVAALKGCGRFLDEGRTAVITELNPSALRLAGVGVADLLDFFPPDRWDVWLVDDRYLDDPVIEPNRLPHTVARRSTDPSWYANLIALPDRFRAERSIDHVLQSATRRRPSGSSPGTPGQGRAIGMVDELGPSVSRGGR